MTIATIERIGPEISRHQARESFLEYRRALSTERDAKAKAEFEILMRSYREIAKGRAVIDLVNVMQKAGLKEGQPFPKLAIGRADWQYAHVKMHDNGGASFGGRELKQNWRAADWVNSCVHQSGAVVMPPASFPRVRGAKNEGRALTPMIPPAGRPTTALSNYYILWDAVWEPAPPADPLLLKHLGGPLYAIVFAWDLTPLEQAVMRGRL